MSLRPLFVLVALVFSLCGCQQAAWKAGASGDDLKRDEQACRQQTSDDAAVKQCLRDKGWTITDFSSATEDIAPAAAVPAAASQPATVSPSAAAPTAATEKVTSAAPAAAALSGAAVSATSAPATNRTPPDPLQRQSVQTWWKAGAQAADFHVDEDACLEQLGTQHTPDYAKHLYTQAMISCLRARGWFAGRDPVYTPLR